MINRIVGGTKPVTRIAGALSVGLVVILLSACGRRDADSDRRALPPSAATVTREAPFSQSTAIESEIPANITWSTTGKNAVGQPSQPAIATTDDSSRSAVLGKGEASLVPSLIIDGGQNGPSHPETLLTPLAAVGFNPALRLNAGQTAEVVRLGQEFLVATEKVPTVVQVPAQVAVSTDDTAIYADASVHAAWRSAQEESDALFRAKFGYSAFNSQLLMRAQQAYRDQLAAGR